MSMPFYVSPEQRMKDRADYARKGIARGRALVALEYDDGIALVAENASSTLRKIERDLRPHRASPVSASTTSSTSSGSTACALPTSRATSSAATTSTPAAWPTATRRSSGQIFTHELKPMEVEILVAEVGAHARRRPAVPHPLRRHRRGREALQRARWRRRRHRRNGPRRAGRTAWPWAPRCAWRSRAGRAGPDTRTPTTSRSRCWTGATDGAASAASTTPRWAGAGRPNARGRRDQPRRTSGRSRRAATRPSMPTTAAGRRSESPPVPSRRPPRSIGSALVLRHRPRRRAGRPRPARRGRLHVLGRHEHVDRPERVRPVDAALQLPDDALHPESGGDDLGPERVADRHQPDHAERLRVGGRRHDRRGYPRRIRSARAPCGAMAGADRRAHAVRASLARRFRADRGTVSLDGASHLRPRERVRGHLHAPRPAPAQP